VTCVQSDENCAGFPIGFGGGQPTIQVRMETGWIPANSPDSEIAILDKTYNPGLEVWFHHACAPHHANEYCDGMNDGWTATSMSQDTYYSDGLDSCWPNHYPGKYPSSYDNPNEGHKGIPSPFTALRHWEVVGGLTGDTPIHRALVIRIPAALVSTVNYFPMTATDPGTTAASRREPSSGSSRGWTSRATPTTSRGSSRP